MGFDVDDSPRWRSGPWTYRPGELAGGTVVLATWADDAAPTWAARFSDMPRAVRAAIALACGQMHPELLTDWQAIDVEGEIGLAS